MFFFTPQKHIKSINQLLQAFAYVVLVIIFINLSCDFINIITCQIELFCITPFFCFILFFFMFFFDRKKFQALRLMVLQMPIIQGSLLVLLNVFNAIDRVN